VVNGAEPTEARQGSRFGTHPKDHTYLVVALAPLQTGLNKRLLTLPDSGAQTFFHVKTGTSRSKLPLQ
jgi:hypothetical protein